MKKTILPILSIVSILCSCSSTPSSTSTTEKTTQKETTEFAFDSSCKSELKVGETAKYFTNRDNVTIKGDDSLVASIDENGNVTALRSGIYTLSATDPDDEENVIKFYVSVKNIDGVSIEFTNTTDALKVGASYTFNAKVTGASDTGVYYQVNNEAMASIDENGKLEIKQLVDDELIVTAYSKINPDAYVNHTVKIQAADDGSTKKGDIETKHGYSLIFEDSFSGTRINTNNWELMIGDGSEYSGRGWGNDEQEFYTKDNAKAIDGNLIITAKNSELSKSKNQPYTSSRLRSRNKVAYKYGRIEAEMTLPKGRGLWPAFWMLPEAEGETAYGSWPNSGEIDIMEANGRRYYEVNGTLHYYDTTTKGHKWVNGTYTTSTFDIQETHVYAVEWDENEMRWYVDDNEAYFISNQTSNSWTVKGSTFPAPFDKKFHILLNLAVGGNYVSNDLPSDRDIPAQMKVNYVKWYQ